MPPVGQSMYYSKLLFHLPIGMFVSIACLSSHSPGLYVLPILASMATMLCVKRGFYYCKLKRSHKEGQNCE